MAGANEAKWENRVITGNPDALLCEDMGKFYDDPLGFVMYAYPWDTDPSLQVCKLLPPWRDKFHSQYGPDAWACELLDRVGKQVRDNGFDGVNSVRPIREAIASGHGVGKSCVTSWLSNWIMSTRPFSKGVITATTGPQLETKTWAEIAKWTKKSITGHWFEVSTGRGSMKMVHKEHPESWRCDAQTCREENSEAFAGLHAANSTPFYIFDEASGVPDKIKEVSEGGLTDGEPMIFAFGNPTQNTGWFKDCFNGQRHRWNTQQIDSRTVQITNKTTIQEWIDDYGLDSDFVKVRVRGMFPAMSAKQFISTDDVDAALGRFLRKDQYAHAPKILTCDPAWEGDDDLVIGLRQGMMFQVLRVMPKNDNDVDVANMLARYEDDHRADGVIIDIGYGTGIYSVGQTMGRDWLLANFGGASPDEGCLNLRAYMWREMRDWLKEGGAIPNDQVMYRDLIAPETVPRMDGKIQLEAKKDMKRRKLASPNRADALALSFAFPISHKRRGNLIEVSRSSQQDYDPYARGRTLDVMMPDHNPYAR